MKLYILSTVCAAGILCGCMPFTARADNTNHSANNVITDRLITQYEQTKDKELLATIEKITIASTEQEQKTAQNRDKYLFWLIALLTTFVFCFACIVYGERQKRYKN